MFLPDFAFFHMNKHLCMQMADQLCPYDGLASVKKASVNWAEQ